MYRNLAAESEVTLLFYGVLQSDGGVSITWSEKEPYERGNR